MNDKHELGLPLEYQQMPEYFDAHNVGADTEPKNNCQSIYSFSEEY